MKGTARVATVLTGSNTPVPGQMNVADVTRL